MYKYFSRIYDEYMEYMDYKEWIKVIEAAIVSEKVEGKKLLDVGCGTGELLNLLKNEYECSGLDISKEMLEIANKKLKKSVNLYHGDMIDFEVEDSYDIIVAFFDTVNHILYEEDLLEHFKSIEKALKPGGIYIFDVVDREFIEKMFINDLFVDNREKITTIWEHSEEDGIDYIDATYFFKIKGNKYEKLEEEYSKKIYTDSEIRELIVNINNLNITKTISNDIIAGSRFFYIIKKDLL